MSCSVVCRIKSIKQPGNGYLPPSSLVMHKINDGVALYNKESVQARWVGQAVDYIVRYIYTRCIDCTESGWASREDGKPVDLDAVIDSILYSQSAYVRYKCKLIFHVNEDLTSYVPLDLDENKLFNIKTMVRRTLLFLESHQPVQAMDFGFSGAYTSSVVTGEGDFIADNVLWDLKVSKSAPTKENTLQILMYYVLGLHSNLRVYGDMYQNIKAVGIYNPRLNRYYICNVSDISEDTIKAVERDVIGYDITKPRADSYEICDVRAKQCGNINGTD